MLLLPTAVISAPAYVPGWDQPARDYLFFFDERFAEARRLADEMCGATEPTPVQSDITAIWTDGLGRAGLTAPMTIKGVTTESFYFCLKILLADHAEETEQGSPEQEEMQQRLPQQRKIQGVYQIGEV